MSLFKINRGKAANLPAEKTDGYAYFTTDDGKFYIDWKDAEGTLHRTQINPSDVATEQADGWMAAADKKKLDDVISEGNSMEAVLATASWSSTTTTMNGTAYYTYTLAISNLGVTHPDIFCGSTNSTIPSGQEETEFNHIKYALADITAGQIIFYSELKPSVDLTIIIKNYQGSSTQTDQEETVTIAPSDWSDTATSIGDRSYLTAKKTLSGVNRDYPNVICGTASSEGIPSEAEQEAFNRLNYVSVDISTKIATFYAVEKPESDVVAVVIY